ncbi:MAG: phosphotransferase family protein, partial [Steroidobacteraceae bacterium]
MPKWFVEHVPEVALPLEFTHIPGGRSNLTFRVDDAIGQRWVLRRPPMSRVLPTAHDMACTDDAVNQASFYVMEFVDGHVLRSAEQVGALFDESDRPGIGVHLAEVLALLHSVDPDDVGLGDLARRDGYIDRQLRRWTEQFRHGIVNENDYGGVVELVASQLAAQIPEQAGRGIVHGDFRLDNAVFDDRGEVRAILDWELCTLGDPMADVGLLMV